MQSKSRKETKGLVASIIFATSFLAFATALNIAASLVIAAPADAREWPNDYEEIATHPVLLVSSASQLQGMPIETATIRKLRGLYTNREWKFFTRDSMSGAENFACRRLIKLLPGKSYKEMVDMLGAPDISDAANLSEGAGCNVCYYEFGFARMIMRMDFKDGKCLTCRFAKKDDAKSITAISEKWKESCLGKTRSEIDKENGEKTISAVLSSGLDKTTPEANKTIRTLMGYDFVFHFDGAGADSKCTSVDYTQTEPWDKRYFFQP